jgi:iron complex transport system substrate-binding protein
LKKILSQVLCLLFLLCLTGCALNREAPPAGQPPVSSSEEELSSLKESSPAAEAAGEDGLHFTDALGYPVHLKSYERVISLYGSFAETWMLAGGTLAGTTSDAIEERGLAVGENTAIVGTVKEPNLEEIIALAPDFVILSADIAGQAALHESLVTADIPHAYYRVDAFSDYLQMLSQFCEMTGREDLYEQNGLRIQKQVDQVLELTKDKTGPSVLLLRAFSSGVKAKGADNLAGVILRDLHADNLADRQESLLEDVSLEEIIACDPEIILIVTMGASEEKAMDFMAQRFESDPAWAGLSAVQSGRYLLLPKELFHYKPNARWGESYAYLAKILYPELAAEIG